MAGEWIDTTVGQQATLQRGIDITKAEQRSGAVPVISSGGVSSYHDTSAASGPGVILGRKGVVGSVYFVASDYWPHDTTLWVKDFHGNDPRFVYYFFRWMAPRIATMDVGSANPTLNRNHVHPIEISWPSRVEEQRAIAHILGTLDDKIELNRRMNETLEAIARALFKSWFVDFDPVRAKAEGRNPGLPKPLADLLPDSFEDSELGEIPKEWQVGRLDSVLVLQRGFDLPSSQRTAGAYPVLAASGPNGTHNEFMVRGPGVTTGRSGVLGKVFYVHDDFWPLNTSLWVKEFRHSMPAYAFHLLQGLDFGSFNAGSAVPTLNRNHVHNRPVLLPPMGLIAAFERVATTTLKRQKHNDDQSLALAALRDTVLPKLISGELRVKDAERTVERTI